MFLGTRNSSDRVKNSLNSFQPSKYLGPKILKIRCFIYFQHTKQKYSIICAHRRYYYVDKIKMNEIEGACARIELR